MVCPLEQAAAGATVPAPKRADLIDLFERVRFHPLSIRVLVQQLKTRTPRELGRRLEQLLAAPSAGRGLADSPDELVASLQLSLDRLDDARATSCRGWASVARDALAGYLYQADDRTPHQAREIAWRELPNLLHAVHAALDAGDPDVGGDFADSVNRFLGNFGLKQESEALVSKSHAAAGEARVRRRGFWPNRTAASSCCRRGK